MHQHTQKKKNLALARQYLLIILLRNKYLLACFAHINRVVHGIYFSPLEQKIIVYIKSLLKPKVNTVSFYSCHI